jgi:hypothetical protein
LTFAACETRASNDEEAMTMSVIMTMVLEADGAALERYAAENPGKIAGIRDHAVEHGLIAHRFYGSGGHVMVVDEWPDAESFLSFFGHVGAEVGEMMAAVGVVGEPEPKFWHQLETHDAYGWNA